MFDYERDTRSHYQDSGIAKRYHQRFSSPRTLRDLRHVFVAWRERRTVEALLGQVPAKKVIDVPTGTGKLAPVFRKRGCHVLACDVSTDMLSIARETYRTSGPKDVTFRIMDLAEGQRDIRGDFDTTVCLRLLHRVPRDVKKAMLRQIALLTAHAIVSVGIESRYHRCRRAVRTAILGGDNVAVEAWLSASALSPLLEEFFDVLDRRPIARGLSSEWVFLLRSKLKDPEVGCGETTD